MSFGVGKQYVMLKGERNKKELMDILLWYCGNKRPEWLLV